MSIRSSNPFALLNDDDNDVSDIEQSNVKKAAAKAQPAKSDSKANVKDAKPRNVPGLGKDNTRNARGPRQASNNSEAAPAEQGFEKENRRDDRSTRGRGGRGGRGGAREGRPAKGGRPDRHSQTDRVDSAKAEHQGWGGDEGTRELQAEVDGEKDAKADATEVNDTSAWDAPATTDAQATETANNDSAPAPEAEPEDNSMTYEEYMKSLAEKVKPAFMKPEARKANEGLSVESVFENATAIAKKGLEAVESYFTTKEKTVKQPKERKQKEFIEITPRFDRPDSGRGGRGRGRGRGGEMRGGFRGTPKAARGGRSNSNRQTVNLDDSNAFPTLS